MAEKGLGYFKRGRSARPNRYLYVYARRGATENYSNPATRCPIRSPFEESQFLRRQGMQDPNGAATAQASGTETVTDLPTQPSTPPAPVRRKPKISEMPPPPPPVPKLGDYEVIIGKSQLDELRFVAQPLQGKRVKMVNSTAVGGGVAEMLNRLVPLLGELGVKTGWEVITGGNDFFDVTKGFHNALHGAPFM